MVLNIVVCVAGTAAILFFAIGLETGASPAYRILAFLVGHWGATILAVLLAGVLAVAGIMKTMRSADRHDARRGE
ncbi:MAG: hypothetical protein U1D99_08225 [Candidatus Omnitrophota bacterium]|nr:hypothetical protein [Candidatus Omnitrophota bacterium]